MRLAIPILNFNKLAITDLCEIYPVLPALFRHVQKIAAFPENIVTELFWAFCFR